MNLTLSTVKNTFAEDFWQRCFAALPLPLCILDEDGKICASNPAWRTASATPQHIVSGACEGMDFLQHLAAARDGPTTPATPISPLHLQQLQQMLQSLKLSPPAQPQASLEISHIVDQQVHLLRLSASRINPTQAHLLLCVEEFTDNALAQETLDIAAVAFRHSDQAIMVTDANAQIIAINPGYSHLTGYSAQEVIGKNPSAFSSGRQNKDFFQLMWHALKTDGSWQGEIWNRKKDGSEFAEWITINAIYSKETVALPIAQRKIERYVAMFSDITAQKITNDAHWRLANFDQLTKLPNRRLLLDRIETELRKANRQQWMVAVFFIDLDHFKEINDQLGHAMGDVLLIETARRLQSCVRESDTVARLGGDEFIIVMSEFHDESSAQFETPGSAEKLQKDAKGISVIKPQIEHVAQTILQTLNSAYQLGNQSANVSASIGIALYPQDAIESQQLIECADQAMYAAKHAGKNRYSYFHAASPPLKQRAEG